MYEDLRDNFQAMQDDELRATVCFFQSEYTCEALDVLKSVAFGRGYSTEAIYDYRESCYPDIAYTVTCVECENLLDLEKEHFVKGEFVCRKCNSRNLVDYMSLEPAREFVQDLLRHGSLSAGVASGFLNPDTDSIQKRDQIIEGAYWAMFRNPAYLKRITGASAETGPDELV